VFNEMTDGEKEQIKLGANALDRASTACIAAGVLTPLANVLYGAGASASELILFSATVAYLITAVVLHHTALWLLEGLDQ
jgi:hypothetical protein